MASEPSSSLDVGKRMSYVSRAVTTLMLGPPYPHAGRRLRQPAHRERFVLLPGKIASSKCLPLYIKVVEVSGVRAEHSIFIYWSVSAHQFQRHLEPLSICCP